MLQIPF